MQNQPKDIPANVKKHQDYLTAHLLDFFRTIENENKWMQAIKIALNLVERVANTSAESLERSFGALAYRMKNNINPKTIREFAVLSTMQACRVGFLKEEQNTETKNLERKTQKQLSFALNAGCTEPLAVHRVAQRLLKEKKEQDRAAVRARIIKQHPMAESLSLLVNNQKIAKEDIRNHLLNLGRTADKKSGNSLMTVLRKAQSFSIVNLHNLLGDDLFFLCRPLGFLDQRDETVVVEVPSSAHMHALTYRKLEILKSLKKDPAFEKVKTIRFKISGALF